MIYELNHAGGRIRDLDASLAFYDGLGAEVVDRLFMAGPRVHRVHLQLATGLVELLHHEEPDESASYGLNHIGFMTDDLDGDYARLMALGYAEISALKVAGSGQGRLAFLADPNGVRVELLQREEEFRVPPMTTGPVRHLSYVGIPAADVSAATEFYAKHLGMDQISDDTFRLGHDAVKLLPSATAPMLALTTTEPRPATADPDGNWVVFLATN